MAETEMRWLRAGLNGTPILSVHVQPGARRSGVVGTHGGSLKIAVREKPSNGAANRAVCELIASLLDVPPGQVSIASGSRSRSKTVRVAGVDAATVKDRISDSLPH